MAAYGGYAAHRVVSTCPICGTEVREPAENIALQISPEKGEFWPDALECAGGFMGLYVASHVKETLDNAAIKYGRGFRAVLARPYLKKLQRSVPPSYFYLPAVLGAKLDFAASGYRIASTCSRCGRIRTDAASEPSKYKLIEETWNGSDIFYTDLSPVALFCSDRVLTLARENRWTNFRFVPPEQAHNYAYSGINYLAK